MTLIGTIARSVRLPCTDSARVISQARSAPVMVARMTSLTVPPCTRRTRAVVLERGLHGREPALLGQRRAERRLRRGAPARTAPRPRSSDAAADRAGRAQRRCSALPRSGRQRRAAGGARSRATASATSAGVRGAGSRPPVVVDGARAAPASTSRMTWPRSIVDTPSTRTWCDFDRIANRPSSTPSMRYTSHSGRLRSSWRDMIRAVRSRSWSIEPGRGSAERRTW